MLLALHVYINMSFTTTRPETSLFVLFAWFAPLGPVVLPVRLQLNVGPFRGQKAHSQVHFK